MAILPLPGHEEARREAAHELPGRGGKARLRRVQDARVQRQHLQHARPLLRLRPRADERDERGSGGRFAVVRHGRGASETVPRATKVVSYDRHRTGSCRHHQTSDPLFQHLQGHSWRKHKPNAVHQHLRP